MTHRIQLLRALDKFETGDRLLAASNGREQSEQRPIPCCDTNDHKEKGATPSRTSLRGYWLLKNTRSLDGLPGLVTGPDAILSMTPQSHFDKDTRPMMRHKKEKENGSKRLVFGDHISFASGFMSGAVAMLVFAAILGKLKL